MVINLAAMVLGGDLLIAAVIMPGRDFPPSGVYR
jgi:hypothetical protein